MERFLWVLHLVNFLRLFSKAESSKKIEINKLSGR